MTLPINHVVLASGAITWTPPERVEYLLCSALYDPLTGAMRLVLEGTDDVGEEVRSVFYWDKTLSEWLSGDYARRHTMLLPLDYDLGEDES